MAKVAMTLDENGKMLHSNLAALGCSEAVSVSNSCIAGIALHTCLESDLLRSNKLRQAMASFQSAQPTFLEASCYIVVIYC